MHQQKKRQGHTRFEWYLGLADKLKSGADLRQLVAAAALANARTFGGEDCVGY